jgi:uncharacterized membrane protein YeaQ/YmgE (transglycosylase-associated protein family)
MIGMSFVPFLSLLVIGAVCAFVSHFILNFRVLRGGEGYLCEWIMGWIGAWIGSAVVGHWGWMVPDTSVYLVPAMLASLSTIYMLVALVRVVESVLEPRSLHDAGELWNERNKVA